jgi:hypothetical protein
LLQVIKGILVNKKYSRGSLYGAGIFPFWLYIKFFGKPVYLFSRKLGMNKYFSLMMANILGSAFHVNFFESGVIDFIPFFISLFSCAGCFYLFNVKKPFLAFAIFMAGFCLWGYVDTQLLEGLKG